MTSTIDSPTNGSFACFLFRLNGIAPYARAPLIIEQPSPKSIENTGSDTQPVSAISDKPIFAIAIFVAISGIAFPKARKVKPKNSSGRFATIPISSSRSINKLAHPHIQMIDNINDKKVKTPKELGALLA